MTTWKRLVPVCAVAALAGCSATAGVVTAPTVNQQRALQGLRGQLGNPNVVSPVFADGDTHDVAIAVMKQLANPAVPEVDLFRWDRNGWRPLATVTLDVGGSVATDDGGATTPITTADLTPATTPELIVTVHYNAGPATAVLSAYGGRWHSLTFRGGLAQDGDERFNVTVGKDGSLRSQENDCVPNCAAGHLVTTVYRFDAASGTLLAQTNR